MAIKIDSRNYANEAPQTSIPHRPTFNSKGLKKVRNYCWKEEKSGKVKNEK
jgi:hypothetical protein